MPKAIGEYDRLRVSSRLSPRDNSSAACQWQHNGSNMHLEDRNLYVTGAELTRIAKLRTMLTPWPGTSDRTFVLRSSMSLGLVQILLSTASSLATMALRPDDRG
jgi:hypothetical protein